MKEFDFEHETFLLHCPHKRQYLRANQHKPITEEQFVEAIQAMPKHLHWSRGHSPSAAKEEYQNLVTKFGFFLGGQA